MLPLLQTRGDPKVAVLKKIISTESLPVLGTGKLDYVSVTNLAKDAMGKDAMGIVDA